MVIAIFLSILAASLYLPRALSLSITRKFPFLDCKRKTSSEEERDDDPFNLKDIVPVKGLPIHQTPNWPRYWKSGKYQMTMAQRKLDINNWLNHDANWEEEHKLKRQYCRLPDAEKHAIVNYLDGEDEAVCELLNLIVAYMTTRYPDMYQLKGDYVTILPVQETYRVKKPFDQPPMEICGLLASDDVYILKKGADDLYYLYASHVF